jgi:hypothetical protein
VTARDTRRLRWLFAAGWIDSLFLAFAWTLVILSVVDRYGLGVAGLAGAAMLTGTALAAPVASHLAYRLDGCHLLRVAGGVEAILRALVFVLLLTHAPVAALLACVVLMNITAWTGYAGMRAEVAAIAPGPRALTVYCTGVAGLEAIGAAAAVLLPGSVLTDVSPASVAVVAAYVISLVPTLVVAGGSPIGQALRSPQARRRRTRASSAMVAGTVLMFLASGPTLLSVALAAEMFGRHAVAPAAIAFTAGSFTAPFVADFVERRGVNGRTAWAACALGMVAGWPFAGASVAALCAAQFASGVFMTSLEGLLDAHVADRAKSAATGALARVTAGRAMGSAVGTAVLPIALAVVGLTPVTIALTIALAASVAAFSLVWPHRSDEPRDIRPAAAIARAA